MMTSWMLSHGFFWNYFLSSSYLKYHPRHKLLSGSLDFMHLTNIKSRIWRPEHIFRYSHVTWTTSFHIEYPQFHIISGNLWIINGKNNLWFAKAHVFQILTKDVPKSFYWSKWKNERKCAKILQSLEYYTLLHFIRTIL